MKDISYQEICNMRIRTLEEFLKKDHGCVEVNPYCRVSFKYEVLTDYHNGLYDDFICFEYSENKFEHSYLRTTKVVKNKIYEWRDRNLSEFVDHALDCIKSSYSGEIETLKKSTEEKISSLEQGLSDFVVRVYGDADHSKEKKV